MDLVILVPDKSIEAVILAVLQRAKALGIREPETRTFVHPGRDPGCRRHAGSFLQPLVNQYDRALVVFDHEGCGDESTPSSEIEAQVGATLEQNGWSGRAATIVIAPELETWVWSDSPHVASTLGWSGTMQTLRVELVKRGLLEEGQKKPLRPKEAVQQLMREARIPLSSAVYRRLAEQVSLRQCEDRSFRRLLAVLEEWFPTET